MCIVKWTISIHREHTAVSTRDVGTLGEHAEIWWQRQDAIPISHHWRTKTYVEKEFIKTLPYPISTTKSTKPKLACKIGSNDTTKSWWGASFLPPDDGYVPMRDGFESLVFGILVIYLLRTWWRGFHHSFEWYFLCCERWWYKIISTQNGGHLSSRYHHHLFIVSSLTFFFRNNCTTGSVKNSCQSMPVRRDK